MSLKDFPTLGTMPCPKQTQWRESIASTHRNTPERLQFKRQRKKNTWTPAAGLFRTDRFQRSLRRCCLSISKCPVKHQSSLDWGANAPPLEAYIHERWRNECRIICCLCVRVCVCTCFKERNCQCVFQFACIQSCHFYPELLSCVQGCCFFHKYVCDWRNIVKWL